MNRKLPVFSLALLACAMPLGAQTLRPLPSPGDPDINQWADSVVRIFSQDGNGNGFQTQATDMIYFGTGFLINDAGYIVTNNHVASRNPNTSEGHSLCVVIETVTTPSGKRRYLHKARAVWFSPTNDLAVLQCQGMHARPIPLDVTTPRDGDNVHCLGYPTISDAVAGGQPEFARFFLALAQEVGADWDNLDTWDITDLVNQRTWPTYCQPTRTDGRIRDADLVEGAWSGSDDQAQVPVIQHSLDILPGNSGGPLVSDQGGVIGVVGDGMQDVENGSHEVHTEYATAIAPLVQWLNSTPIPGLDDRHHYYQLWPANPKAASGPEFFLQTMAVMIVLGLLLALGLEFVILRLTWEKVALARTLPPLPVTERGLASSHGSREPPASRMHEFARWIPVHMPHPGPLLSVGRRHPRLLAGVGLVAVAAFSCFESTHPKVKPSSDGVSTTTPMASVVLKLSPSEIAAMEITPPVPPPDARSAGLSQEMQGKFLTVWRVSWPIALIGLASMAAWRLVLGAVRYFRRSRG